MAKLAACYAIQFSSYMCYAITALRVLTHAPWNDDMFYGHIRELILCAIGNGWTWKEQSAAVQGRRITTVEVCAALASYSNPQAFPPGQISALDSAIIAVCDDLFPAHVDFFFAAFAVHCSSCNAQGQASVSIFDSTLLTVPESSTIDLAQMLRNRNPRLALDREDVDFAHYNECADREQLSYDQNTAGLMFVLQIISTKDQLPTLSQAVVLLGQAFDVQNIGSNPTCQLFRVSGLIMVQGRTSHHFFVIEKVDHDKVLLHDNLLGYRWIPINEVRQPVRAWGFILRHNEHPTYSFQPVQYKVIAPNAANPKMPPCRKKLKPKNNIGIDSKRYEFSAIPKKSSKKSPAPEDPIQMDKLANPARDSIVLATPTDLSTPAKSNPMKVNHRGVPMADSTSAEQAARSSDDANQDQALSCSHPRVPGADVITHHSDPHDGAPLQADQGTDDCLKNFGHLRLDCIADTLCNPTQEDQQSTSPAETPPSHLLSEEQQAVPHQRMGTPSDTSIPESKGQPNPANVPASLPVMPLPDINAQADRESDCPPPHQVDTCRFNGKSPKEKEVSPPKRTRFSELHPYAIISLFDGVGSAIPAIAKAVGGPPSLIIAAECDPILRQIVSEQFLFRSDGKWTKSCPSTYTIYTDDVRNLLKERCRILRETFFLAGPQCRWIVVAGSPCQDLTSAGPYQGLLGLTGPCSSMFYYVHIILWILQMNYPIELIRFLLENAGTMLEIHRKAILKALGLNPDLPPDHFRVDPKFSHGVKRNRFYFRNYPDREAVPKATGLLLTDQEGPLLDQGGEPIPFGPLLRVRAVLGHEVLQLSWTSYQPIALIWDYLFWGGKEQFQTKAKMQFSDTMPALSFVNALPPHYLRAWKNFLQALRQRNIAASERDELVRAILPIFHHPFIKAPMRILRSSEVEQLAGLHNHFHRVQTSRPLLTEYTVRNYCGNGFHPAHIQAAIGQPERLRCWLAEPANPPDKPTWQGVAHPKTARTQYHELRDKVLTTAQTQHVKGVSEKQIGLDPMPDFPIHAFDGHLTPVAPSIMPMQILPVTNKTLSSELGLRENTPPKQLSLTAIHLIKQRQMQDILTGMRFFGAGIGRIGDIFSFFFGQPIEVLLTHYDAEHKELLAKQLASCAQNSGAMMQILLFILTIPNLNKGSSQGGFSQERF